MFPQQTIDAACARWLPSACHQSLKLATLAQSKGLLEPVPWPSSAQSRVTQSAERAALLPRCHQKPQHIFLLTLRAFFSGLADLSGVKSVSSSTGTVQDSSHRCDAV